MLIVALAIVTVRSIEFARLYLSVRIDLAAVAFELSELIIRIAIIVLSFGDDLRSIELILLLDDSLCSLDYPHSACVLYEMIRVVLLVQLSSMVTTMLLTKSCVQLTKS